ncbi:hypothetical protein F3Y22_tig00110410pilonHSYRG00175 [Hibiscus syriacus]|uniref:Bulb-type lectin domain-containing protein n=1 Tax=Hibiscus syriacus TaxID=106335 RepID=A0A6A3ASF9_HIBSY|nr:hypothetical protein F3Y22_tig00110410pilonHSYRG00175 [Hibiscus syriacus]
MITSTEDCHDERLPQRRVAMEEDCLSGGRGVPHRRTTVMEDCHGVGLPQQKITTDEDFFNGGVPQQSIATSKLALYVGVVRGFNILEFNCLIFLIYLCLSPPTSGNPNNFLKRGSYLSVEDDKDLLISSDNKFTCGFYGVGKNPYYFSIWFSGSKEKTVAWMANRDKPVNGKGSKVSFLQGGAFVLTNVDGSITWETNTRTTNAQTAELLDNGNLVLDSSAKVLWQIFDFPTDTLLPHQHFTKSNKLISRLGGGNYGNGYLNIFFDIDNVLRLTYDGHNFYNLNI